MKGKWVVIAAVVGVVLCLALTPREVVHQSEIVEADTLVAPSVTIIDSTGSMASFYSAMNEMDSIVPIVHFGDSHIQGGFLSEVVRKRFAEEYGSAGRGFLTPHKLSKKNEPRDYSLTSSHKVTFSSTIASRYDKSLVFGVSGVMVDIPQGATVGVKVFDLPNDTISYPFSRVNVFCRNSAAIASKCDSIEIVSKNQARIFLHDTTRTFEFTTTETNRLSGVSVETDSIGVLYHSIGVNGATFMHWGRHEQAAKQTSALSPKLIIISLGSNEAIVPELDSAKYSRQIDSFVSKLQKYNPAVPILLVTAPEAMKKGVPNSNFEIVRNVIKSYAKANNLAFYDLYEATGGKGSANEWKEKGMLYRDGIHFEKEGYALQGEKLFEVLNYECRR